MAWRHGQHHWIVEPIAVIGQTKREEPTNGLVVTMPQLAPHAIKDIFNIVAHAMYNALTDE